MQVRTLQVAYDLTVEPTSFSSTPTKKRLSRKVAVCEEDFVAPKVIVKKKPRLVLSPITVRQQESTSAPPPVKPSPIIPIKRLVKPKIEEIPLPPPIKAKHYDPKVVKSYMEKKAKEKKQEERFLSQNQAALKAEVKEKLTKLNNFRQEQLATIKKQKRNSIPKSQENALDKSSTTQRPRESKISNTSNRSSDSDQYIEFQEKDEIVYELFEKTEYVSQLKNVPLPLPAVENIVPSQPALDNTVPLKIGILRDALVQFNTRILEFLERDSNPNSKLKFPDSLDKLDSNVIISNESYNQIGVGDMSSFQDSRHSTQKVASNLYNEQIPLSAVKDQVLTINSSALDIGIGSLNSYNSNQKNKNTRNAAAITIQRFWRDKRRRLIYSPDFSKYKKVDITDYQISTHDSIFDNVISLDDETSDVYSVANVFARRFASIADLVIEPEIKNTENAKNIPEEIPEYIVSSVENEVDSLSTPVFTEYSVIKDFEKIQKSIDSVYLNDFEEDSIDSSVVYENNFGIEGVSFNQALKPIVEIKPINDIPVDTEYTNEFDEEEEISDFKIEENIKAENIGVNSIPVENYNRSRFKVDRDISEDSDSDSSDSSDSSNQHIGRSLLKHRLSPRSIAHRLSNEMEVLDNIQEARIQLADIERLKDATEAQQNYDLLKGNAMLQREEDQKENIADGSKSKIYEEETFDSISDIAVQVDDEIVEKYSHNIIDKYVSTTVEENELDKLLNSFVGDTENDVILKLDQVSDNQVARLDSNTLSDLKIEIMQKLLKGELADIKQRKMALDTRTMAGRSLFDRLSAQEEIMLSKYTVEKAELEKAKVELREGKSKVQKSDYESSFDDVSSIGEEISNSATGKVKSDFLNVSSDSDVSGFETMVQKMKALRRKNDIESLEIKKKQLSKSKHITVSLLKDRKTTVDLKRSLKDETRKLNRVLDLALDNIEDDISFEVLGKKNQPSREQTDDISEDIPEVHSSESDIKEDIVADSLEDVASSIIQEEFEFDEPVTSKTKSLNIKDSIAKTLSVQAEFDEFVLDIEKNVAHLSDDELNTLDRLKLLSRTISEKRKIADNLQYKKVVAKKTLKERLRETEIKLQKELDSVNDVIVKTEIDIESINLIPDEIDSLSVFISPDTKSLVEKNNANENSIVELKSVAIENENLKVTDFNYEDETFDDDFELSFTNNDYITQSIINPIGDVFDKSIVQDEVSFIDELIEEEIVQEIETEPEIQIKQVDSHIIEPVNDDFIEIEHQVVINQQESSFDLNVVINKQESSFDLNENNKSMNTEQSDSDSISINSIENQTIDQIPSINNDVETEQIIIIENDNHKDNDNFSPSIVEGIDESEDEEILIDEEFLAATDELKSLNLVEFGDSLNQASIAHEVSTEIIQGFNDYSKVISEPEIAKKEPVLAVDLAEITEPFVLSDSIIIAAPKTEEIEINSSDTEKIPDFVNDSDDSLQSSPQSYNNPISENLIETLLADMIKSEVEFMIKLKPTPKKIVSVESIVNISDQILEDLSIQMFNQVNMEIKLRNIDVPDELLAPEATRNEARISTANTIGRTSTVEIRDVWKGWGSITILIDLFMSTFSTEQVSQTEPPLIPASIMQTDKFKQEKAEDDFLYSQRLLVFEAINEAIGIVYKDRKYGEVLDFQKVKDRAIAMIKEWSDYPVVHRENLDELLIKEVREEEKLWARLEFEQIEVVDMLVEQVFAREILKF